MNGYFQLSVVPDGTAIKVFPATDGGEALSADKVIEYLDFHHFDYDMKAVGEAVQAANGNPVKIISSQILPERESYKLEISQDKMQAIAYFYAPSEGAGLMDANELIKDLAFKKIKFGIQTDAISKFFASREYCKPIVIAQGQPPRQGSDAKITYHFNTDLHAKPQMKEDGSVDYFHLDLICPCHQGDVLATLTPADFGDPGQNIYGDISKPRQVKVQSLHFGKNVSISEDKLTLTAECDGHVIRKDGKKVIVSNVLTLANVDVSSGNIEFDGSVDVKGDVAANFSIKAAGNVQVHGNVEGAEIEADGDVILERGMNGMGKGKIVSGGRVVTKFLENASVSAAGSITAEAVIHSNLESGTEVVVSGRKGFISGGHVVATEGVTAKTLGSEMGSDTLIEVGVDPILKNKLRDLQKNITSSKKTLDTINPQIEMLSEKMKKGVKLTPEQLKYLQQILLINKKLTAQMQEDMVTVTELQDKLMEITKAWVKVEDVAYPGTIITIGSLSKTIKKPVKFSRFAIVDGDVGVTSL